MGRWLINPFRYISGWPALIIGVAGLLLMAFVSSYSKTHLDGVIDVHFASKGDFLLFLKENTLTWGALMLTYGISGLMISGRNFRFIDLAAYTALMRLPLLIAVFFPFLFNVSAVADYILYHFLNIGNPVSISTGEVISFVIMTLLTIVLVFWSLIWGYYAFKTLFNVKGIKAAALFFMVILIAEALVKAAIYFLFEDMMLIPV